MTVRREAEVLTAVPASAAHRERSSTHSETLESLVSAHRTSLPRLIELSMTRPRHGRSDVRIVLEMPSESATEVDRALGIALRSRIDEARVRSITPTPGGARLDLEGAIQLSTARRSDGEEHGPDGVAGAMSRIVADSGATLRRLDVPRGDAPIRMVATGDGHALVTLLQALEETYTAPVRIEELRVAADTADRFELRVAFRLRDQAQGSMSGSSG